MKLFAFFHKSIDFSFFALYHGVNKAILHVYDFNILLWRILMYIPQLTYANEKQLEYLHQYSVDILCKIGMRVEDPEIRKALCEYNCIEKGDRILFSESLIEKTIKNLKHVLTFTCHASGKKTVAELYKTITHSTGGAPWILDPINKAKRNGMLTDLVDTIHVMNQLPELDIPCALLYPSDVSAEITQLKQTATMFQYSRKPIYGPGVSMASNAKYIAELFKVYGGGADTLAENPIGMVGISPESPLFLPKEITDTMKYIIGAGIPTSVLSAPMGGLTSPLSVAGTVTQAHAEILGFACVAYLINPKCTLFYGSRTFFANMKNAQSILGLPETGISSTLCVQLANRIGFMTDIYGMTTTSCAMDEQAAYEKMLNGILPSMAHGTIITGFGCLASNMACSLGQLVLDNEMMAIIRKAQRAMEYTPEEMGLEALEAVINDEETFLVQDHTLDHLYDEVFQPEIGFDSVWADWSARGEVPLNVRAEERARELIQKDGDFEAPSELITEAEKILNFAEKELM